MHDSVIRRIRGPMIVVHDRGGNHHNEWVDELQDDFPWLILEKLPPYAPELNPMEAVWNFLADKQLVNYAPYSVVDLDEAVHDQLQPIIHDLR
jgi:putative transposase